MALSDRISPLCDLLLGAAYADKQFKDRERQEVREMLVEELGASLTSDLEAQIDAFEVSGFELETCAAEFADDPEEDRVRLLGLVAAINDVDDEVDFAEDEYLRKLAKALKLPDSALKGLTVDVEVEELRTTFEKVRKPPPLPPKKK
jgi:uncharacterized tellurite resistance protein B-like protein